MVLLGQITPVASRQVVRKLARNVPKRAVQPRHFSSLQSKVDDFQRDIEKYLPKDGKKVVFATAWLATDNVFVASCGSTFQRCLKA